jgi:hypothetical protein
LDNWTRLDKWYKVVTIIAGLLAIGTAVINVATGWPFRSFLLWHTHQLVSTYSIEAFKIETIQTACGTVLTPPDRFSYKFDIPLETRGTTKLDRSSHVWVVVKDQSAGYYLQVPAVEIKDNGKWLSYNIRPLAEIKQVIWVLVDDDGNDFFSGKVKAGEWGKFTGLPQNTQELAYMLMR